MTKLETNAEIEAYCQEKYAEFSPPLRAFMDAEEENAVTALAYTFSRAFSEHIIACIEKDKGRPMTAVEKLTKVEQCSRSLAAMVEHAAGTVQLSIVPAEEARHELDILLKRASQ